MKLRFINRLFDRFPTLNSGIDQMGMYETIKDSDNILEDVHNYIFNKLTPSITTDNMSVFIDGFLLEVDRWIEDELSL